MSRLKSKTHDQPIVSFKSSKKIKKLKKRILEKRRQKEAFEIPDDPGITSLEKWKDPTAQADLIGNSNTTSDSFDPKTYLYNELKEIVDLLALAKGCYRDLPDGENATSLSMLLREMRGFVGDLHQITQEDKDNIFRKVDKEIIQPMFKNLIRAMVTELNSTKGAIIEVVGEDRGELVDSSIKTTARNLRPTFVSLYAEVMQDIAKLLGAKSEISHLVERMDQILKT